MALPINNKKVLHLNLKSEYFIEIRDEIKEFEYRLKNEYWSKKLLNRDYDEVHFKLGYPKRDDNNKIIKKPYCGYEIQKIKHKHFGEGEVEVFAIIISKLFS